MEKSPLLDHPRLRTDNKKPNKILDISNPPPPSQDVFHQWESLQETEFDSHIVPDPLVKNRKSKDKKKAKAAKLDINEKQSEKYDRELETFGSKLDVPGSELDDEQENVGSEDEENNYYSIGGDRHNDLEESDSEPNR
jgi:hypothetical protein